MNLEIILTIVSGLVLGSFLNVVIYRLPRGESLWGPFSKCPSCGKTLKWYHNIPLLSYILLRGRCAYCSEKISLRYPFVELSSVLLLLALYFKIRIAFGFLPFVGFSIFGLTLLAISFIDLSHREIPDLLSIPLIFIGWIFALTGKNPLLQGLEHALISSLAGIGLLFLINELYYLISKRDGIGMGDFKLMGGIGAFLGYKSFFNILFFASLIGLLTYLTMTLYMKIVKKEPLSRGFLKTEIPFGPFLSLSALIYLFNPGNLL